MFDNIGRKIKALAKIICWMGIIISIFIGINIIIFGEVKFNGALIMILGPLLSWVGSFVLYGYGQIIENTDKLVNQDTVIKINKTAKETVVSSRFNKLNELREQGLISEEEYQKALNKDGSNE